MPSNEIPQVFQDSTHCSQDFSHVSSVLCTNRLPTPSVDLEENPSWELALHIFPSKRRQVDPPLGVTLVSPVDACGFEHLCLVLLVSSNSVPEKESNGYWGGCTKLSCTRVSEYLDLCIVCTSWHFVQKTTQSQPVQNLMFQLSEIFWEYSGFISGNTKIARYRLWIYGQFIFQNEMSFTNLQQLSRFHSAGRWQQFHFGAPCGWWQYWTLGRWSLSKGLSLPDTQ